jgi:hybrid cluster-associated redox disulfide protein
MCYYLNTPLGGYYKINKEGIKMITKDMSIIEIASKYPKTLDVFAKYGMGCIGCAAARFENLEQGALAHGIDVDAMVKDLNDAIK